MTLAKRLAAVEITQTPGCYTCAWLRKLSDADRQAFNKWISDKNPIAQLWEISTTDPDSPLKVTESSFRRHIRHHVSQ